jgi:hypothetical protein
MRSLATLGVPLLDFGNAEGGIPLSRITDVALRDAALLAPLLHSSEMDGGIPLSRLTDVLRRDMGVAAPLFHTGETEGGVPPPTASMWRNSSAVAPSEQDDVGGASTNAWSDWERSDAVPLTPSPDPRSHDFARHAMLGKVAYAPDGEQIPASVDLPQQSENSRWGDNVPRIVVTPKQFEPWTTPEGRPDTSSHRSDWQVSRPAAAQADQSFGYDYTEMESAPSGDRADALSDLLASQSNLPAAANAEQTNYTGHLTDTDRESHNRVGQPAWNGVQLAGLKPLNPFNPLPLRSIPDGGRGGGGGAARPPGPSPSQGSPARPPQAPSPASVSPRASGPTARPSTQGAPHPPHRGPAPILTPDQLDELDYFGLLEHLEWLAPDHPTLRNLPGPDWRPTDLDKAIMRARLDQVQRHVVAVRQNQRYKHLGQRPENHHADVKHLGGPKDGPTVTVPRDFHRVITTETQKRRPYRLPRLSPAKRLEILKEVYDEFPLPWWPW